MPWIFILNYNNHSTNSIEITSKKHGSERDSSVRCKVDIDAAREESEQCFKDAVAPDVSPEKRRKLLNAAMVLGTLCDSLEQKNIRKRVSFGQTNSSFGKVVLSRVPSDLKS